MDGNVELVGSLSGDVDVASTDTADALVELITVVGVVDGPLTGGWTEDPGTLIEEVLTVTSVEVEVKLLASPREEVDAASVEDVLKVLALPVVLNVCTREELGVDSRGADVDAGPDELNDCPVEEVTKLDVESREANVVAGVDEVNDSPVEEAVELVSEEITDEVAVGT